MLTNNGKAVCFISDYWEGHNPRYILCRTNGQIATFERKTENFPAEMNFNYVCNNLEIINGSGTTAATVYEIKLENEITANHLRCLYKRSQNAVSCNRSYTSPLIMHATKTYYNNSKSEDIIINEIGLITKDGYDFNYLLAREVLEEPIILSPNENITFTISID